MIHYPIQLIAALLKPMEEHTEDAKLEQGSSQTQASCTRPHGPDPLFRSNQITGPDCDLGEFASKHLPLCSAEYEDSSLP